MSESWIKEGKEKLLNAIMNPKCEKCYSTGVIPGPTFNGNDPNTYEDFTYCNCEIGIEWRIKNEVHEEQNEH